MSIIVCGSLAYDHIMVFQDKFSNHILADKIDQINVSFFVPSMRRDFGGTAGNIAYNIRLLETAVKVVATLGKDGENYLQHLQALGIDTQNVVMLEDHYTAQAFITTDINSNQITAFHPGAMSEAGNYPLSAGLTAKIAIVSPDAREAMLAHCQSLAQQSIPLVFDPGQALPILSADDLRQMLKQASYCAVNEYEASMLSQRLGVSVDEIASGLKALIITRGADGADIYAAGKKVAVTALKAEKVLDPTGCGDAFRAGLLLALASSWTLKQAVQLGSVMGAIKVASEGPQNHHPSFAEVARLYQQAYGESLPA